MIGKQQLEIERIKAALTQARADKREIADILCCIGGALNDNVLGYTGATAEAVAGHLSPR